jgi:hypothetical protein
VGLFQGEHEPRSEDGIPVQSHRGDTQRPVDGSIQEAAQYLFVTGERKSVAVPFAEGLVESVQKLTAPLLTIGLVN